MFSSLSTGLSGLQAHQFLLDIVGNNLANASTLGYRSSRVTFADLLSQVVRAASSPGAGVGGTNPVQIGRGVRPAAVDLDASQGALQTTGRPFDLAIQGAGFFTLTDGRQDFFSRVGTFGLDASGTFIDTRNGLRVRSAGGSTITINQNQVIAAKLTSNLELSGSLPATITGPIAEVLATQAPFEEATAATILGTNTEPFALADGMTLSIAVDGGAPVTVTFNAVDFADITNATAAEVAAVINAQAGSAGLTASDVGGAVEIRSNTTGTASALAVTDGTGGPAAVLGLSTAPVTGGQSPATAATELNDLLQNTTDYVDGDVITITGTDGNGSAVSATFTYGAANDGTTLGALVARIDAAFAGATAALDADGNVVITADAPGEANLSLTLADAVTPHTDFSALRFRVTTEGVGPDQHVTSIDVFDSLGRPHTVTLTFTRDAANVWSLTASVDASEGTILDGVISGIQFNEDGSFSSVTGTGAGDANLEILWNGLTTPQTIALDFGSPGAFDGLTQIGNASTAIVSGQDGYEGGSLATVSVSREGVIEGFFTNGQSLALDRLRLATFANPAGLLRVGDTLFQTSSNSGTPIASQSLQGNAGAVISGALEGSNVDVAREFVNLILAQRGFQVNARSITTADQVLQELVNIVR
jgi:flagellar hook protein FlgE